MIQLRNYTQLSPIVSGYELDDQFSVVVPINRVNLCINPSFETNTTSWTAIGGSIARTTTQQYHGAFSLAITPTAATTDGARFDTVSLTAGSLYAYSAKVLGQAGRSYKLALETTGAVELASTTFVASGRWQWIVGYYAETSTTTRRLTVRKAGGTDVLLFYIDGAQVEAIAAGELVSTYIDGSQQGLVPNQQPPAYFWNGTPHASTSARSGLTRAGGMVIPFKNFGFLLSAIIGLGLAPPQNVATEYARIDGGYDDYTRKPTRQFTIQGNFEAQDYLSLRQQRGGLSRLLDRDLVAQDQRIVLLRHVADECGNVISSTCQLLGKYQDGLGGNTDNHIASVAPITFTQYLGVVLSDGESGGALGVQTSVPNTASIAERLPNGTWRAIASTFNNSVFALLYTSNSRLVIAGSFTTPQTRVASWDGITLSAMGAGLGTGVQSVQALVEAPDGTVYAGLDSTVTIGGVTGSVVQFTAGAWAVVGATGTMTDNVQQMVWARNGNLYAVGNSTIARATLARWNGTAWSNLFTHTAGSTFFSVVEGFDGLYIGGTFTNLNADANQDGIVKYSITGAVFSAMSTGLSGGGIENEGLAVGADGRIYLAGSFTTAGGIAINHAAVWNGVTFASLGTGLTSMTSGLMRTLPNGTILTGGDFTAANGITFPDPLAIWNGGTWIPLDANLPTQPGIPVLSIDTAIDGRLAVGYNDTGSSTSAATTIITNPGTARSYPTLTLTGPTSGSSRIWQCVNITTNKAIYFNYTMLPGEVATLIFTPDNLSFTSTFAGNISSTIIPGSNVAEFYLQPGANIISFFSADTTVTAVLFFRPAYVSLDDIP